jgi:hypothetical protein
MPKMKEKKFNEYVVVLILLLNLIFCLKMIILPNVNPLLFCASMKKI